MHSVSCILDTFFITVKFSSCGVKHRSSSSKRKSDEVDKEFGSHGDGAEQELPPTTPGTP